MNDYEERKMNPYLNLFGNLIVLGCIVYTLDISLNNRESVVLSGFESHVKSLEE
jgi:hypothetical protein|tara:strand:+ start:2431 stop:2592 length:162 start_codon:yes stop_codon:yes gene_type:complete